MNVESFYSSTPTLISVSEIRDDSGAIGVLEPLKLRLPIDIARVYWLFDLVEGCRRGQHAHRTLNQIFIAMSGAFRVQLDDGCGGSFEFNLRNPTMALFVPAGFWRTIEVLEVGSVLLVLASQEYTESDYFRDFNAFVEWKNGIA